MAEKFNLSVILKFISDDKGIKGFKKNMKYLGSSMKNIGQEMTTKLSLPIMAFGGLALKSAIDIESAFVGVRKTVNASEAEFKNLKKELSDLSLKIPVSLPELMGITQIGGQLGIATKHLASFASVIADTRVSTNLLGEDAAASFAGIATLTRLPQDQFRNLASEIVALGNTMNTNEKDITNMALALSASGTLVGMSTADIVAFAASLATVKLEPMGGGTAFSRVMDTINAEIGTGSEKLNKFAATAGMTSSEFSKAWTDNPALALTEFIKGLARAEKADFNLDTLLRKMGFNDIRITQTLKRATLASDTFTDSVVNGNKEFKKGTALEKEANQFYKTTASELKKFKNELDILGEAFGKVMIPGLRKVLKELKPFITELKELSPEMKDNIIKIAGVVFIGGPLLLGLGVLSTIIGTISLPLVLIVGSIALLAGLGKTLYDNWDKVKAQWLEMVEDWKTAWKDLSDYIENSWVMKALEKVQEAFSLVGKADQITSPQRADVGNELFSVGGNQNASITIKVESENGTSAKISEVKNNGTNLKVENKSTVGPTMNDILAFDF